MGRKTWRVMVWGLAIGAAGGGMAAPGSAPGGAAGAAAASAPAANGPAANAPASSMPAADLARRFPEIRRQLASEEYARREAGQKLLDALAPSQVEALRALAEAEGDPEVKARLEERVNAMDIYVLVHPPGLTLHAKDATLADICAELNRQLGGETQVTAVGNAATFSLEADHQPFWEIVRRLNAQSPLTITSTLTSTVAGIRSTVRLSTAGTAPREYQLVDGFLLNAVVSGSPATGTWAIRVVGNSDPRVRITQYSPLRIDKITDQDGRSLMPLVLSTATTASNLTRPASYWNSSASLAAAVDVTRIKELKGSIGLSILQKEQMVAIDLTKEVAPVETSRGRISVDKNGANGALVLHISAPPADPTDPAVGVPVATVSGTRYTTMRVFDKDGKVLQNSLFAGTQINVSVNAANGAPSRIELSWPEKSLPMTLPVELKDLALPAGVVVPVRGRGAILP